MFSLFLAASPPINLIQLVISIPLILVLIFGIGFILNMILKTTWIPLILYLALVIYLAFQLKGAPQLADITWFIAGLAGAVGCGWTIRYLRQNGYRMF
nr:YuiB family protein [Risungbinella massiliensis]